MCFSSTASFVTGAALLPAGVYCLRRAARVDREALAIAAIPIAFGVQQFLEGFVWAGLDRGDPALTRVAALAFLFFAIVFWPFWIPWSASCLETRPARRRAFRLTALAGLAVALAVFLPLAAGARDALRVDVLHHSIRYAITLAPILGAVPLAIWSIGYVMLATTPLLIAGGGRFRVFGLLLLVSAIIAQAAFWYAFISIWCAFAAVLSIRLAYQLAGAAARAPMLSRVPRAGVLLVVLALGGGVAGARESAPPPSPPAPASRPGTAAPPALGRFHLWLKAGRSDLAEGGGEWGLDRVGYLALEGFVATGPEDYFGLEFGSFNRDESIDEEGDRLVGIDSYWLEFNGKHAFPLAHQLSIDAGAGAALFYIDGEEVTSMGGIEVRDPLADIGYGVQLFGDFNWRFRHLLAGLDLKAQWAFDVIDINYSNIRLGAHLGLAF